MYMYMYISIYIYICTYIYIYIYICFPRSATVAACPIHAAAGTHAAEKIEVCHLSLLKIHQRGCSGNRV